MAKAAGISVSSVQRIWRAHGLQPHRVRQFKLSKDPQFAAKLHEIVGLYVDPPDHAIVLSVDEKSQIQALDRTQPGLPMKKVRAGTMTHDYKRHGVIALFAALNVPEGKVIGQCMKRHRNQEFIRFLNLIKARVPKKRRSMSSSTTHPQASRRHGVARKTLAVCLPLHPDIRFLAQRYRGLLCQAHKEPSQARRIPISAGTQRCHSPLPRPHQRKPRTLYLDQGPKQNHRRCQTRVLNVRFDPLALRSSVRRERG